MPDLSAFLNPQEGLTVNLAIIKLFNCFQKSNGFIVPLLVSQKIAKYFQQRLFLWRAQHLYLEIRYVSVPYRHVDFRKIGLNFLQGPCPIFLFTNLQFICLIQNEVPCDLLLELGVVKNSSHKLSNFINILTINKFA